MTTQSAIGPIDLGLTERDRITELLTASGGRSTVVAVDQWKWKLGGNGSRPQPEIAVSLIEDWVLFEGCMRDKGSGQRYHCAQLTELLRECGGFAGGVKVGLEIPSGKLCLTAEVSLADPEAISAQLEAVRSGLLAAVRSVTRTISITIEQEKKPGRSTVQIPPDDREINPDPVDDDLTQLASQMALPFTPRAPNHIVFEISVRKTVLQANLVYDPHLGGRLSVDLVGSAGASAVSQLAMNVLLLTSNRLVRLVRAVCCGNGQYRWEKQWPSIPTAVELRHALSALSVACRLTANEFEALADEQLAAAYLASRGWSP